jgi:diguanylate cyclase (GGDEF)-like protein
MESLASPFPETAPIDLRRFEHACAAAVAAAGAAGGPAEAIDAALGVLHDELSGAGVAVFVVEHGRLWSVGVRGYAMIPDGLPLDEGVIGRAVRTSEAQFALDGAADPDFVQVSRAAVSELAIPLVLATGVVGVINIETSARLPEGGEAAALSLMRALAQPVEELRAARTVDLSSLARLFVHMSSLRNPLAIAEIVVRSLGRVLPVETSQLLLLDENGELVESAEWRAAGRGPEPLSFQALRALREEIDTTAVFELLDTTLSPLPELAGLRLRSVVLIPLRANGAEIGLLVGASRFVKKFDRGQGELASLLAAHAAASLDAAIALDRERRSAHTDPLTGLLNRRGLEDGLDRELTTAQEGRKPVSLVVLDCDDFKDVNDRAGHEFGDALLREVGHVLGRCCREGWSAGRLGGDEFVVILPGVDAEAAPTLTDSFRRELAAGLDDAGFPLRLSAGISTYPYDGGSTTQLLRAADQALYRAKASGKNRVIAFREIVKGVNPAAIPPARGGRGRSSSAADGASLGGVLEASAAIWAEESVEGVLERLSKAISFVVGATATAVSKVDGPRLTDVTTHTLRDIDLVGDVAYLIADFPVTQEVLESATVRSLSFLDDDVDSAEAFVLRELGMNAALLAPLLVHGRPWGLVEIYDMRLRRFTPDEEVVAWFLVEQAARRIESLGAISTSRQRLLRLWPRTPAA